MSQNNVKSPVKKLTSQDSTNLNAKWLVIIIAHNMTVVQSFSTVDIRLLKAQYLAKRGGRREPMPLPMGGLRTTGVPPGVVSSRSQSQHPTTNTSNPTKMRLSEAPCCFKAISRRQAPLGPIIKYGRCASKQMSSVGIFSSHFKL